MAQQALPQGATRRRAAFGLFDADGWTWAGLKATFWFLFIILMLGVVPNWAYYFTTSNTITVGYNFASIVNLCPADNEDLPCPAPIGAMKPWQTSPPELALPAARSGSSVYQSGSTVYLLGGLVDGAATDEVLVTEVDRRGQPPALERRSGAARAARRRGHRALYAGMPYLIGGLDASGPAHRHRLQGRRRGGRAHRLGALRRREPHRAADAAAAAELAPAWCPGSGRLRARGWARCRWRSPPTACYLAWADEAGATAAGVGAAGGPGPARGPCRHGRRHHRRLRLRHRWRGPRRRHRHRLPPGVRSSDEPATDEAGDLLGWAVAPA